MPEPLANEEARHGPDGRIGLVLAPAVPRDAEDASQTGVVGARLDPAPADGLAIEIGDQARRRLRLGMPGVRLLTQPEGALLGGEAPERLLRRAA